MEVSRRREQSPSGGRPGRRGGSGRHLRGGATGASEVRCGRPAAITGRGGGGHLDLWKDYASM